MGVLAEHIRNASIARLTGAIEVRSIPLTSMPRDITDDVSAEYISKPSSGQGEPLRTFHHTSARRISFSLRYWAKVDVVKDVIEPVNFLRSLVYPLSKHARSGFPPPLFQLRLGSFLNVRGVVISVGVTWRAPYQTRTLYPMIADVNLVTEAVMLGTGEGELSVVRSLDILKGRYFTGGPMSASRFQRELGRVPFLG